MHSKDVSPFELFSECGVSVLVVNEFYKLVTTTFSWCRLLVVPHNIVACRRTPLVSRPQQACHRMEWKNGRRAFAVDTHCLAIDLGQTTIAVAISHLAYRDDGNDGGL